MDKVCNTENEETQARILLNLQQSIQRVVKKNKHLNFYIGPCLVLKRTVALSFLFDKHYPIME